MLRDYFTSAVSCRSFFVPQHTYAAYASSRGDMGGGFHSIDQFLSYAARNGVQREAADGYEPTAFRTASRPLEQDDIASRPP